MSAEHCQTYQLYKSTHPGTKMLHIKSCWQLTRCRLSLYACLYVMLFSSTLQWSGVCMWYVLKSILVRIECGCRQRWLKSKIFTILRLFCSRVFWSSRTQFLETKTKTETSTYTVIDDVTYIIVYTNELPLITRLHRAILISTRFQPSKSCIQKVISPYQVSYSVFTSEISSVCRTDPQLVLSIRVLYSVNV